MHSFHLRVLQKQLGPALAAVGCVGATAQILGSAPFAGFPALGQSELLQRQRRFPGPRMMAFWVCGTVTDLEAGDEWILSSLPCGRS